MRVVIADDEARAREFLQLVLEKIPGVEVVGRAGDGNEAVKLARELAPDLMFLDIRMPGLDGLGVARELVQLSAAPRVVFVTAYDQYAVEAFRVQAMDYLIKPFTAKAVRETVERFRQADQRSHGLDLEKVLNLLNRDRQVKIPLPVDGGNTVLLDARDIHYIERRGLEVLVKTSRKVYTTNINLKDFEQKLDPRDFFRCHKGYIVRLELIEEIVHSGRTFELLLSTGDKILLSREKEKQLRHIYEF